MTDPAKKAKPAISGIDTKLRKILEVVRVP
jgi:hypothetical protein